MDKKFDVAISFCTEDEVIARRIYDELSKELEVFFFPESQKHLAGTDGMESMRVTFFKDSHLNLVLLRERWGQKGWTTVEYHAIVDRCRNDNYRSLFAINLNKDEPLQSWLPHSHVRFNVQDYSFDQMIGAIKMRVQEQGAKLQPMTATKMAQRLADDAEFKRQQYEWVRSVVGMNTVKEQVLAVFQALQMQAKPLAEIMGLPIGIEYVDHACIVQGHTASLNLVFEQHDAFSMDKANLGSTAFRGRLPLRGQMQIETDFKRLGTVKYKAEYCRDGTFGWIDSKDRRFTSDEVAEQCLQQLLATK